MGGPARASGAGWGSRAFPAVSSRASSSRTPVSASMRTSGRFESNGPPEDFLSSTLDDRNAQFSPDGKKIAFESRRLGKDTQIWVANSDGTNPAPLTEGAEGVGGSPRWSPDSRSIVFDGQEPDGRRAIYVVDAEGGRPRLLTTPGHCQAGRATASGSTSDPLARAGQKSGVYPQQAATRFGSPTTGATMLSSRRTERLSTTGNGPVRRVLFARPVAGGPERQVLDSMGQTSTSTSQWRTASTTWLVPIRSFRLRSS